MTKEIFRVGDRVFDIDYGWGEVTETHYIETTLYPILVKFQTSSVYYTLDGKWAHGDSYLKLSFTEYDFVNGGFSQERPIDYTEYIGKWGKFWNDKINEYTISKLERIKLTSFVSNTSIAIYDCFEPLTDEQIKILGLE